MADPKGKPYTIIAFDDNGNPVALRMNASGELMTVLSGGGGSGTPAIAKGRLITPVVFDPDGKPVSMETDEYGQLKIAVEGLPSTGNWTLLEDVLLLSDTSEFDFTSISSAYKHLRIIGYLRSDFASGQDSVSLRFNGDSGSNYDYLHMRIRHSADFATAEGVGATFILLAYVAAANSPANAFDGFEVSIPNYANTGNEKTLRSWASNKAAETTGNLDTRDAVGWWRSNAAINRITIVPSGGSKWKARSRATLYGLD